jgi:hypothetical protein
MRRAMAALLVVAACGKGDPAALSVEMRLDAASCTVADPDALQLDCAATAGVWLRGGASGDILDQACVDFGGAGQHTLADLPPLLAGVDLSTASTGDVWIEVAVYAPWSANQGCPTPDALPGGAAELIVSGSSERARLSGSTGSLEVLLSCSSLPASEEPDPACLTGCDTELDECFDEIERLACEDAEDLCADACPPADDECEEACEVDFVTCVSRPEVVCGPELVGCLETCDPETDDCFDCEDVYLDCLDETCNSQFDSCSDECEDPADGGCASIDG